MILNLNNGEEITNGDEGWDTEKPYSEQTQTIKTLAMVKGLGGFFTGTITNETSGGNTRPVSSSWVEFGLTYTISPIYMTSLESKSFLLWTFATINITKNI